MKSCRFDPRRALASRSPLGHASSPSPFPTHMFCSRWPSLLRPDPPARKQAVPFSSSSPFVGNYPRSPLEFYTLHVQPLNGLEATPFSGAAAKLSPRCLRSLLSFSSRFSCGRSLGISHLFLRLHLAWCVISCHLTSLSSRISSPYHAVAIIITIVCISTSWTEMIIVATPTSVLSMTIASEQRHTFSQSLSTSLLRSSFH